MRQKLIITRLGCLSLSPSLQLYKQYLLGTQSIQIRPFLGYVEAQGMFATTSCCSKKYMFPECSTVQSFKLSICRGLSFLKQDWGAVQKLKTGCPKIDPIYDVPYWRNSQQAPLIFGNSQLAPPGPTCIMRPPG